MKGPRTGPLFWSVLAGVLGALLIAGAVWSRPPSAAPSVAQIQDLLPSGSLLHSLVRLEMNGRPPLEVAVVAGVPAFPGAAAYAYYGFIFAYEPWRRRTARVYAQPLPGTVPLSIDGGRLLGSRDAAVFAAANDDGGAAYRVVALRRWTFAVVHEAKIPGRAVVVDPFLVEVSRRPDGPPAQRVLGWDGRRFRERVDAAPVRLPPPGRTWYYGVRNRLILAPAWVIHLRVRQPLRVTGTGPGRPGAIVVPDAALDLVESGYRARRPGTYRIRLLLPFSTQEAFSLTLIVDGDAP